MKVSIDFTSKESLLKCRSELQILMAKIEGGLAVFEQREEAGKAKANGEVVKEFLDVFHTFSHEFTSREAFDLAPKLTKTQVRNAIEQLISEGKITLLSKGVGRAPSRYQKVVGMDDFERAKGN
jgi:hypothetical protein